MSGTLQLGGFTASSGVSSLPTSRSSALLIPENVQLRWPYQEAIWQPQKIVCRGPIEPAMLQAESHRSYSWWWDSHVSPKNSRWLQENLTDMDIKVKAMLKLIEEDADSFAKRAEMYYKKRPELVHLVEEFYRAYRALAERYDHISGELRQVHYSMAEAFPNHIQYVLHGDSPQVPSLMDSGDQSLNSRQTTQSLAASDDMKKENAIQKEAHVQTHKKVGTASEETEAANEDIKMQGLQQVNEIILQYRATEKMVSQLQEELKRMQEENQKAKENSSSQIEQINGLKQQVFYLKKQNKEFAQEGKVLKLKLQAETQEQQKLRTEIQSLLKGKDEDINQEQGAKDDAIANLQDELSHLQQENHKLSVQVMTGVQQLEKVEEESHNLQRAFSKSHAEQETMIHQYQKSLNLYQTAENRVKDLQVRMSLVQEENKRLKDEVSAGALHLKVIEEKARNLERDNNALQQEMEHRIQKTNLLTEELTAKHNEEQNLRIRLQDETDQNRKNDTALKNCQQALSQSQEQRNKLMAELQVVTDRLKDADTEIKLLEDKISQLQKENDNLVEQISSAVISNKDLEEEVCKLKQEKINLFNEVAFRVDQRNALQQELYCLQEERNDFDRRFQTITKQIETLGLDAESLQSAFVSLQNDNQKLRQDCQKYEEEKLTMEKTVQRTEEELTERNTALENAVSSHNVQVGKFEEEIRELQLLSQGLQEKTVSLMVENEQHTEQVKVLETNLKNVQKLHSQIEGENLNLNHELTDALVCVKHLEGEVCHLQSEKGELENAITASTIQVSDLQKQVDLLEAERKDLRTNLEEETKKQKKSETVIGQLQQLLCQMEERNRTLSDECQKQIKECRTVEERMREMEKALFIQKTENDSLLNDLSSETKLNWDLKMEIEKLQNLLGIPDIVNEQSEGTDSKSTLLLNVISEKVKSLQIDLSHVAEENKRLSGNISTMSRCLEQFKNEISVLQSEKQALEEEAIIRFQHLTTVQNEMLALQGMVEDLKIQLQGGIEREGNLQTEIKNLKQSLVSSKDAHLRLQFEYQRTLEDCNSTKTQIKQLEYRCLALEQESQTFLNEALTQTNLVTIWESNNVQKDEQIQQLVGQLNTLHEEKKELESDVQSGATKVQMLEVQICQLQEQIHSFQEDNKRTDALRNDFKTLCEEHVKMGLQIQAGTDQIKEKDTMLGELRQQLQAIQEENAMLVTDFENVKQEHATREMKVTELQQQISFLTEETIHLKAEVSIGYEHRGKLEEELVGLERKREILGKKLSSTAMREKKLQKDVQQLQQEEENLKFQLQKQNEEAMILESEVEKLYEALQFSQIENTLLVDGNQKIIDTCKNIERRTWHLQGKLTSMEQEKRKQGVEAEARLAQINKLWGTVADLETEKKIMGAEAATILQKQKEEAMILESEVEKLYEALQFSQIENTLLVDGNQKIVDTCKNLERRTWHLQGKLISMEQEQRKQGAEAATRLAQINKLQGTVADLETEKKIMGAEAATMFSLTTPLKKDISALKEQVLDQMKVLLADTQMFQDHLLRWLRDDVSKLQATNRELNTKIESQDYELQTLQSQNHTVEQIVIELEKKNRTLNHDYQSRMKEHCEEKARLEDVLSEKICLETENSSIKMELQRTKEKVFQLQEEGKIVKDELQLRLTEVETLEAKLKEANMVEMQVLRLLDMVHGSEQQHESLSTVECQFAEDKLKEIHQELFCLRVENEKLKNDALQMAAKIDRLEGVSSFKDKEGTLDDHTHSYVHINNFKQESQQIDNKTSELQGSIPRYPSEKGEAYLWLGKECNIQYPNNGSFTKEEMFLEGFDVPCPKSDVGKEERMHPMQEAEYGLKGFKNSTASNSENDNVLEEFELLRKKYDNLEDEVQELREKTKIIDAGFKEAQNLEMKLEEMQPDIVAVNALEAKTVDVQELQAQIGKLQAIVNVLQQENSELKGECTDGRRTKFEELSHYKEPNLSRMAEEASPELQEEKEVVVDEVEGPENMHEKVGQEIDLLQEENRQYWTRLESDFNQMQTLQNAVQDLQQTFSNLKRGNKKLKDDRWTEIEYNTVEKQLRDLQGELGQLLEHNNRLRKDVKNGFASVNRIQEEMDALEGGRSEYNSEEIEPAKFDKEVLILRQQNSKIAERLQSGSEKAQGLELEVPRIRLILSRFQEEMQGLQPGQGAFTEKKRVPLKAFLVGKKENVRKRRTWCACVQPKTDE
eukprot:Gb_18486 [translate_table: standard]